MIVDASQKATDTRKYKGEIIDSKLDDPDYKGGVLDDEILSGRLSLETKGRRLATTDHSKVCALS